jgi:hypothetical protein
MRACDGALAASIGSRAARSGVRGAASSLKETGSRSSFFSFFARRFSHEDLAEIAILILGCASGPREAG